MNWLRSVRGFTSECRVKRFGKAPKSFLPQAVLGVNVTAAVLLTIFGGNESGNAAGAWTVRAPEAFFSSASRRVKVSPDTAGLRPPIASLTQGERLTIIESQG